MPLDANGNLLVFTPTPDTSDAPNVGVYAPYTPRGIYTSRQQPTRSRNFYRMVADANKANASTNATTGVTTPATLSLLRGTSATVTGQVFNVAKSLSALDGVFRVIAGRPDIITGPKIQSRNVGSSTSNTEAFIVCFETDSATPELFVYDQLSGGGNYRILIDEQDGQGFRTIQDSDGRSLFAESSVSYTKLTFGDGTAVNRKWRRYRVEMHSAQFVSLGIGANDSVQRSQDRDYSKAVLIFDSFGGTQSGTSANPIPDYSAGTGATRGAILTNGNATSGTGGTVIESAAWEMCRALNWAGRICWKSGTGLLNDGNGGNSPAALYRARYQSEVVALNDTDADVTVIYGGTNDTSYFATAQGQADYEAALRNLIADVRAFRGPDHPILLIGVMPTAGVPANNANLVAQDAKQQAVALSTGVAFISNVQGMAWTNLGAPHSLGDRPTVTTQNAAVVCGGDSTHLSPTAGVNTAGWQWAYGAIRAMNLPYYV